jgi:hypothetical protein
MEVMGAQSVLEFEVSVGAADLLQFGTLLLTLFNSGMDVLLLLKSKQWDL